MNVPSGYTALDLVGFTDRGTYSNLTNYVKNDLVHYGGDIWKCLLDDTTNKTPAEGTYWTLWIDNNTTADSVSYNNTQSGLSATNVKGAIDEVSSDIQTLSNVRAELGAHNLLPFDWTKVKAANTSGTWGGNAYTHNGITFTPTFDSDGNLLYISVSGTSQAKTTFYLAYGVDVSKYNGMLINGASTGIADCILRIEMIADPWTGYSQYGNRDIQIGEYAAGTMGIVFIRVFANKTINTQVCPQIRLASDSDPTYQPYSKPNTELTKDDSGLTANAFANGAVNLLENKATSTTINGITCVVNNDGTMTFTSDGTTRTGVTDFDIAPISNPFQATNGVSYHISGCPSGGNASTAYWLGASGYIADDSGRDIGNGATFKADSTKGLAIRFYIRFYESYTFSGPLTFKPMVTLADVPNSDYAHYVPFAKSNKELTRLIKKKTATVTTSGNGNASIATDLVPYSAQILAINVTSGAENGAIAVAYKNLGASVNGLHVWAPDGTSLASTQIGIEVIYIDGADVT